MNADSDLLVVGSPYGVQSLTWPVLFPICTAAFVPGIGVGPVNAPPA